MSAGRAIDQLAAMHSANDPWAERRKTDPVLRAVINVLCEHTDVSYYCVDWRGVLFGATCPAEEQGLERGLIQDPDAICGSQSLPYNEGGGGYLERFAAGLGATAAQTGKTISQTIRDELRDDYDRECGAVSPDNERSHLGGRTGRLPTMTFEQLLEAAHWTPEIFAAIDTEVERQRAHPGGHGDRRPRRPARPVRSAHEPTRLASPRPARRRPDRDRGRPHDRAERDEAAGIGLYGLALVRRGLGEPRVVAQLGAGGRGIGPCETDCLDLHTGEEFTVSSTDPEWEARAHRASPSCRPRCSQRGRATTRAGRSVPATTTARAGGPSGPSSCAASRAASTAPPRRRACSDERAATSSDDSTPAGTATSSAKLAAIRADEILRDLASPAARLARLPAPPRAAPAGQLDLFTDT